MNTGSCKNCGNEIQIAIFKGGAWCSDDCRKALELAAVQRAQAKTTYQRILAGEISANKARELLGFTPDPLAKVVHHRWLYESESEGPICKDPHADAVVLAAYPQHDEVVCGLCDDILNNLAFGIRKISHLEIRREDVES